ncbi:AIG2-like protein [Pochonia chlamydosporia 170]|uniref:Putative gamma-glutamylcyclotransferase n=1 Tax=Pochonia chlamydosporia 170 TaxID=1380566 RepID=A0A179FGZ7_METCM|nr:AIG2-like protein [Pochonia chlamydosporia 170]OAQ64804.1 AIG2-like protein [Pochonia chlamydosporia 170]
MSGEGTAFVYGTLMAPEVFFSVCYGDKEPPQAIRNLHTFTPAILEGYCRHRVQLADYPAAVPESGREIRGIYVTGLTDANMEKLDYFEGAEYERRTVEVRLLGKDGEADVGGPMKRASVYVFLKPNDIERREWDFEEFRRDKMKLWARGDWAFDDDDKASVKCTA